MEKKEPEDPFNYEELILPEDNVDYEKKEKPVAKTAGYTGVHTAGFKDFLLKPELN
jgi:hypothetical protein